MPDPHDGRSHLILFVRDQDRSTDFYRHVLDREPRLHVPGMTEFPLPGGTILGLMPERSIRRLLGGRLPVSESRAPRSELYLMVDDPASCHARALGAGATEVSPLEPRDWGDEAAYSMDPDGHLLAFARPHS